MARTARTSFRGALFDPRTAAMLREVERITKRRVRVAQGSWSGAAASAGTHSGPGAVDLRTGHLTEQQKLDTVAALRRVGFAAWLRRAVPGLWGEHIHAIAVGTKGLPSAARAQTVAYANGYDGLAGEGGKRPDPQAALGIKPTTYEAYLRSLKPKRGTTVVSRAEGGNVRREPSRGARLVRRRPKGDRVRYTSTRVTVDPEQGAETWLRLVSGNWLLAKQTERGD